jgi:hypothetical protein
VVGAAGPTGNNVTSEGPDSPPATLKTVTVVNVTADFGSRSPVTLTTVSVANVTGDQIGAQHVTS